MAMSSYKVLIFLAWVSVLAGCASEIDGFAYDQASNADIVIVTAAGVGGLSAATPFTEAAIETAIPVGDVTTVTMATEEDTHQALAVFAEGMQVIQVLGAGGQVSEIHGVTQRVSGPNGEHIGMTFAEARPDPASCRVGTGNWVGMPICTARGAPNVHLVFALPGDRGSATLPAAATLGTAVLQRIVWSPAA